MSNAIEAPERQQWLEQRKKRLGATDISAIFGLNPYRCGYEVWLEKRGLLEDWKGNAATDLGSRLEPALLDEAEHRWGPLLRNVVVSAPGGLPIASTLDGILSQSWEPVETKTAGLMNDFAELGHWGEADTDVIPEWYLVQCHTQMLCTDSLRCRMLALIAGRGIVPYEIKRDPAVCDRIAEVSDAWWDKHIIKGIEPDRDKAPDIEILKRIKRVPNSVEILGDSDLDLVDQWEAAKAQLKAAKDTEESLKKQVLLTIGTNEGGQLPDGRLVTYLEQSRRGYEVKECTYRVLRIKG